MCGELVSSFLLYKNHKNEKKTGHKCRDLGTCQQCLVIYFLVLYSHMAVGSKNTKRLQSEMHKLQLLV